VAFQLQLAFDKLGTSDDIFLAHGERKWCVQT